MQIILARGRGFSANTYIITADNKNAIVVDPAHDGVAEEVKKYGLVCQYVLLTHCHFDHVAGVAALQRDGARVLCGNLEQPLVGTKADLFERFGAQREVYRVDETLFDGETRELCGVSVQTIFTPGHTAGSACYLITDQEKKAFPYFPSENPFCLYILKIKYHLKKDYYQLNNKRHLVSVRECE